MQDLERKLVDAAGSYIAVGDENNRREAARDLCAVVEFVTNARLKDESEWSPHWWVDGLLEDSIEIIPPRGLTIRGKMIWCDERSRWWLEPFEASIELGQLSDWPLTYQLRMGDAARGLRAVPHGSFQRREPVVTEWIFDLRR